MTPSDDSHQVHESLNATETQPTADTQIDTPPERTPTQALVHRLRGAIDKNGRYSYRLNDMAAGYAAGQGLSAPEARQGIEQTFTQEFGMSPHQYLDRHYAARREKAQQPEKDTAPPRMVYMDRER